MRAPAARCPACVAVSHLVRCCLWRENVRAAWLCRRCAGGVQVAIAQRALALAAELCIRSICCVALISTVDTMTVIFNAVQQMLSDAETACSEASDAVQCSRVNAVCCRVPPSFRAACKRSRCGRPVPLDGLCWWADWQTGGCRRRAASVAFPVIGCLQQSTMMTIVGGNLRNRSVTQRQPRRFAADVRLCLCMTVVRCRVLILSGATGEQSRCVGKCRSAHG